MRASSPSINLLVAGSTPCIPATKMKSPARAPTLQVSLPVLIAPGGLSVLTPLGEGDWAKPRVVMEASARPQETKQRANIGKPFPQIHSITAGSPTTYFGVLAVTSTSRSIPGQTRALT